MRPAPGEVDLKLSPRGGGDGKTRVAPSVHSQIPNLIVAMGL